MKIVRTGLWRLWQAASSAVLLLVVLWALGLVCFLHYTASLTRPDNSVRTDAIVVLTGGAGRINNGLALLQDKAAGKLFISGVGPKVSQGDLLALWKEHKGATPCCIFLGRGARNTAENALEAKGWAATQHVRSLRLVTAAYHMPRAWLHFHHALPGVEILICPAPLVDGSFEARHLQALTFVEYNKMLVTWLELYLLPPGVLHA